MTSAEFDAAWAEIAKAKAKGVTTSHNDEAHAWCVSMIFGPDHGLTVFLAEGPEPECRTATAIVTDRLSARWGVTRIDLSHSLYRRLSGGKPAGLLVGAEVTE